MTTQNLEGCVAQLEFIHDHLTEQELEEFIYRVFAGACVKEFEVIFGLSTTLLRRRLVPLLDAGRPSRRPEPQGRIQTRGETRPDLHSTV